MKIDIKKLSDELGLSYEKDEDGTIRCSYCGYIILRYETNKYEQNKFASSVRDDIFYRTRISGEKGVFSFFDIDRVVYNDDYNYNFLKNELIKTINKFKLENIENKKKELSKDFLT